MSSASVAGGEIRTDTSTVSVSVLPTGGALVITTDPSNPLPQSEEVSRLSSNTPQPPSTVSAAIRLPEGRDLLPGTTTVPTFVTVADDRGTGAGWDVVLTATGEESAWTPVFQSNTPSTVSRLLPSAGPLAAHDAVSVGDAVSSLQQPTTVLHAEQGSGAGVYVQSLTISWPESSDGPGLVAIQLPSAP